MARRRPKAGTGKRFSSLVGKLKKRRDVRNPRALAAYLGRKKFGKKRFAKMAAAGRKRRR